MSPDRAPVVRSARLSVFGHEPEQARVGLVPRSRRWRTLRAAPVAVAGVALAPLAALVPPHVPWAAGAVIGGLILARRRWRETHTLTALEGRCPRCGTDLELGASTRLRHPHPLDCSGCHQEIALRVPVDDHADPGVS